MRRFFIFILALLCLSSIFAFDNGNYYIVPLKSSGLDLTSEYYPDRSGQSKLTWQNDNTTNDISIYTDFNIVATGGYSDMGLEEKDLEGCTLSVSVESSTGAFEFASLSNDAYRVPFKLFLVIKSSNYYKSRGNAEKTLKLVEISNTSTEYSSGKISFQANEDPNYSKGAAVIFDVILALPGKFDSSSMKISYDGKNYIVAEKDDYGAMITLNIVLKDKDGNPLPSGGGKSVTIPFGGYVSLDSLKTHSIANMFINALPAASALDLQSDAGKEISVAHLDFLANYGREKNGIPKNIYIYASSSVNPNIKTDQFRFVKDDAKYNGSTITNFNSLGFKLYMKNSSGEKIEFNGESHLSDTDGVMGGKVTLDKKTGDIKHSTGNNGTTYFQLSTDISIKIDTPPSYLEAGRYEEIVYIHVVSEDGT